MFKRLAAVLAVLLVSSCATGDIDLPPEVSLADLRPEQAGLFEQRVRATLRIRNPNDGALPIDGTRFALELNGQPFATGFSDQRLTVPRLSEATIEATAVVSTLDLMRQIIAAPLQGGFAYRLTGTAFVDSAAGRKAVPFEQNGKLNFPHE
jgi:LEA14-like dessication related protein